VFSLFLRILLSKDSLVTPTGKKVVTFPSGITQPVKVLYAALGHGDNLYPFLAMEKELNQTKEPGLISFIQYGRKAEWLVKQS
jgi:hypothetical protein